MHKLNALLSFGAALTASVVAADTARAQTWQDLANQALSNNFPGSNAVLHSVIIFRYG